MCMANRRKCQPTRKIKQIKKLQKNTPKILFSEDKGEPNTAMQSTRSEMNIKNAPQYITAWS
ncbi:hypothetical protein FACS1894158_08580 [Betaproteobacteria bacterium]|nr:hypothetical protein FACS1894158_08580 [Betaproteobacteria bacterium]